MFQELYSTLFWLGVSAVALLTVLYLFYTKVLVVFAWLLHASFAVGLALSTSSLLLEGVYGVVAAQAVENTGIPDQLRAGDAFVRRVQSMPERIYERIRHPFAPPAPEFGPIAPPLAPPPGALENGILPILQRFTRTGLRLIGFAVGIGLMGFGLMFRSRVDLVLEDRALRRRVEALEAQLAALI